MVRPRWLSDKEQRAWRNYRRMRTLLDLELARDLRRESQLSEADYDVLSTLSESPNSEWRARDLAARLTWSTSRLAHQVGRMEQRRLVVRRGSSDDARGAIVALTRHGRTTLERAAPLHVASVRRHLIDLLDPGDVDALARITGTVVSHLTDDDSSEPP